MPIIINYAKVALLFLMLLSTATLIWSSVVISFGAYDAYPIGILVFSTIQYVLFIYLYHNASCTSI